MGRVILGPTPKGKGTGISNPSRRRRRQLAPSSKKNSTTTTTATTTTSASAQQTNVDNPKSMDVNKKSDKTLNDKQGDSPTTETAISTSTPKGIASPRPRTRQALAIDTRLLVQSDDDESQTKQQEKASSLYKALFEDLVATGAVPSAMTYAVQTQSSSLVLESHDISDAAQLQAMTIQPVVFCTDSDNLTDIPKELFPKNSWKLVRTLVDSIFSLEKQDDQTQVSAYDVTVVMRASSLVGGSLAHADGLGATVDHLRAYFQQSKIQSVQIIILTKFLDDAGPNNPELVTCLQTALQNKLDDSSSIPAEGKQSGNAGLPMVISVNHVQDSRVGYRKLVRQLVRQSLEGIMHGGQLRVDLPETVDGMQCELNLDVEYNLLATSLQKQVSWEHLSLDIQALCTSSPLQVEQLIPYSALDASLMFGVPLRVSASAHAQDTQDYQTMQILFGSLLRLLEERELVLLLRVPETTTGGVWLARPRQTLILLIQETPGSSFSPQTAILCGYANACQWLLEDEGPANLNSSLDGEMTAELKSYVDSSLEQLYCGPYNPLVDRASDLWNALSSTSDDDEQEQDESMQD